MTYVPESLGESGYTFFVTIASENIENIADVSPNGSTTVIEVKLTFTTPQDITASAGITVIQGSATGILKNACSGTTRSIVIKITAGTFVSTDDAADVVFQTCTSAADQIDATLTGGQSADVIASSLLPLLFHRTPNNDDQDETEQPNRLTLNKATGVYKGTQKLWCDYTDEQIWKKVTTNRKEYVLTGAGVLVSHLPQNDVVIEARTAFEKPPGHLIDVVVVGANNTSQTIIVDLLSFLPHNTRLKLLEQVYGNRHPLFKTR